MLLIVFIPKNIRTFAPMKTFKYTTCIAVFALFIMMVANVFHMSKLYNSIKEDTISTAQACLRRADLMEMVIRLRNLFSKDDSVITLANFDIVGKKDINGQYYFSDIPEQISNSLAQLWHKGFEFEDSHPDMHTLDSLFRLEMNLEGLNPEKVEIHHGDTISNKKMWHCSLKYDTSEEPVYTACFTPLVGYVLWQMAGILSTSLGIMAIASLFIIYLLRTIRHMRTMDEMKDDFTHNMTHELKSPLAAALAAADSMQNYYEPNDKERNTKLLGIITQRLHLLTGMINNILTTSMKRMRTIKLEITPVHVAAAIETVIETIRLKSTKSIIFNVKVTPEDLIIFTDSQHLSSILTNLIDNAVKYSGNNPTITIDCNADRLIITDNGNGISAKALPHIFEKFYREPTDNQQCVAGYGLGLYYVSQILSKMGWRINVTSTKGTGTSFTIYFSKNE